MQTSTSNPAAAKAQLAAEAYALGFASIGVTTADAIGDAGERLIDALARGHLGTMTWMETHADRRRDPRTLWPDVRSIVMLAMSYAPGEDPLAVLAEKQRGAISAYAKGRDYHDVVKAKLKHLARNLEATTGAAVKVFVDTAPLMEKPLAAAAGLGWQGKHTNLVSRSAGSWLFLGAILSAAELPADAPEADHCGSCRRCLDACPTDAFPSPYRLDARRCIAYLTIEHKGHIAREFRAPIGNRIFGCDDCLAICPWNKFAERARETRFAATAATGNPPLSELLHLDDGAFRKAYAGTPLKRTGRDRFIRNCLIAAGNSGDPSLLPVIAALLSDEAPIVRAMAVWAYRRLTEPEAVDVMRNRTLPREHDAAVAEEWSTESTR